MSKPSPIAGYEPISNHKFWSPGPGEKFKFRLLDPPGPSTFTAYTPFAGSVDWAALEAHVYLTLHSWNEPHVCTHEGPWTLHSCLRCDIRDGKTIVALIAWLTGQQNTLDLMKPKFTHCMHPGASLYEQCQACRQIIWQMNQANHNMSYFDQYDWIKTLVAYQPDPGRWSHPHISAVAESRARAKRIGYGDALRYGSF